MKPISIGVISDIHVGASARSKDLQPNSATTSDDEQYLKKFDQFVSREGIRVDYLLVPGDMTCSGSRDEMELASTVLEALATSLHINIERVVVIPGNHDTYWVPEDEAVDSDLQWLQRYDQLKYFSQNIFQVIQRGEGDILFEPCFSLWRFDNLEVLGINTAFYDKRDNLNHPGEITDESLRSLKAALDTSFTSDDVVRVALAHHHPLPYPEPVPMTPKDFSIMINAESLLKLLVDHRFEFLIHGHKHVPFFTIRQDDSWHPLCILGSGSFSAKLHSRWNGIVNNQFHVVRIEDRESISKYCCGYVESWTFLSNHGWVKSAKHNGIRHGNPFGSFALPKEFENKLRNIVVPMIQTGEPVRWSKIAENHGLKYHPTKLVASTLRKLASELKCDVVEHEDDLILVQAEK